MQDAGVGKVSETTTRSSCASDVGHLSTQVRIGNDSVFAKIAFSEYFQNTTLFVIVLNAFWIGIDVEWNHDNLYKDFTTGVANGDETPVVFVVGENMFCVYFVFELIIRFFAFRDKKQCIWDGWFVFDTILVIFMVVETWIMLIIEAVNGGGGAALPGLSVFRLLRLLRLTRMARIMRAVPELMTLIKGMIAAIRAASVILLFLLAVMYVFAIVFTSMLASGRPGDFCMPQRRRLADASGIFRRLQEAVTTTLSPGSTATTTGSPSEDVDCALGWDMMDGDGEYTAYTRFSSIGSSMMTLFTNGVLGDNLAWILTHIKTADLLLMWVFIVFMVLSSMTLLNMLIGVLCDVIGEAAENEKQDSQRAKFRETLELAFGQIDESGNKLISEDEWVKMKQNNDVMQSFEDLGIEKKDLDTHLNQLQTSLFHGDIDDDEDRGKPPKKGLSFEKFLQKIMELRPEEPASALDVEMLRMNVRKNEKVIKKQMEKVQQRLMSVVDSAQPVPVVATPVEGKLSDKAPDGLQIRLPSKDGSMAPWLKDVPTELLFAVLKNRQSKLSK